MSRSLSGNYLKASHTPVTVGTGSTVVVSANAARQYLLLVNDGTEAIYVSLGGAAALNAGIRINGNGGSYEMAVGYGNIYLGAVTGICTTGGMKLLVTEGT